MTKKKQLAKANKELKSLTKALKKLGIYKHCKSDLWLINRFLKECLRKQRKTLKE